MSNGRETKRGIGYAVLVVVYYLAWYVIVSALAWLALSVPYVCEWGFPHNQSNEYALAAFPLGLVLFFPVGWRLRYVKPWHWTSIVSGGVGVIGSLVAPVCLWWQGNGFHHGWDSLGAEILSAICLFFVLPFFLMLVIAGTTGLVIGRKRQAGRDEVNLLATNEDS